MTEKSCKHCGCTQHFRKTVNANGGQGPALLPLGFFTASKFNIRVCGDCGYTEWFVHPDYLSKMKEKFTRE